MKLSQACKDNNIYAYRNSNVNVLENGNLGLLVKRKGQYHIIYDDEKSRNVSIATILHELGHYIEIQAEKLLAISNKGDIQ